MITLEDAMEYGRQTAKAKKEIVTLATSDEMIRLLYEEVNLLNAALTSIAESEAGASL